MKILDDSELRIDSSPAALVAYRQAVLPVDLTAILPFSLFTDDFEFGDSGGRLTTVPQP